MADNLPQQPHLDDLRVVLELAFMLVSDAQCFDGLLDTLRFAAESDEAPPHWAAANRFVLDAMADGLVAGLNADLTNRDGP